MPGKKRRSQNDIRLDAPSEANRETHINCREAEEGNSDPVVFNNKDSNIAKKNSRKGGKKEENRIKAEFIS